MGALTVREKMLDMPLNSWAMLQNCQPIHHMMTGIHFAGFNQNGTIRVQYEDGTQKETVATKCFLDTEVEKLNLLTFASVFSP